MYVRITNGSFDTSREQEVRRLVEEQVMAALSALPGFQSYQGGLDRGAGRLVSITCWDSNEHAQFSRDNIADVVSQLQSIGVQLEAAQIYEVVAQA